MKNAVENLIKDYNQKINEANELLAELRKGKSSDTETKLVGKISAWKTIIDDLNKILQEKCA